jgi:hypothetical protein
MLKKIQLSSKNTEKKKPHLRPKRVVWARFVVSFISLSLYVMVVMWRKVVVVVVGGPGGGGGGGCDKLRVSGVLA